MTQGQGGNGKQRQGSESQGFGYHKNKLHNSEGSGSLNSDWKKRARVDVRDWIESWNGDEEEAQEIIDQIAELYEEAREESNEITREQFEQYLPPSGHRLRKHIMLELLRVELEQNDRPEGRQSALKRLQTLVPEYQSLLGIVVQDYFKTRTGRTTRLSADREMPNADEVLAAIRRGDYAHLEILGEVSASDLYLNTERQNEGRLEQEQCDELERGKLRASELGSCESRPNESQGSASRTSEPRNSEPIPSSFERALGLPSGLGEAGRRWFHHELQQSLAGDIERDWVLPRRFGDYELIKLLGVGGMGVVFKARQCSLDRECAVKLIREDRLRSSGPEARQALLRFIQEAKAASVIEHENWVTIYDVGDDEGVPYYAMQLVEGYSLSRVIHEGPIDGRIAAKYLRPVALALEAAHQAGIVHRDVKPQNLLVDRKTEQVLLTDFGLAKVASATECATETGEVFGSPHYIAPEQAVDSSKVGPAADIYGFGATLYHVITGSVPFQTNSPFNTLNELLNQDPVEPRRLNPNIDRDLETICLKCLAKQPHQRFRSAQELADELERYLDGRPIHSRPIGWPTKLWRWSERNRALATSLLFTLTVLLVAVFVLSWQTLALSGALARVTEASDETRRTKIELADTLASFVEKVSQNELLSDAGYRPFRREIVADVEKQLEQMVGDENDSESQERAAQIWLSLARIQADAGQSEQAIGAASHAIELIEKRDWKTHPELAELWSKARLLRGSVYFRESQLTLADQEFKHLVDYTFGARNSSNRQFVSWNGRSETAALSSRQNQISSLLLGTDALLRRLDVAIESSDLESVRANETELALVLKQIEERIGEPKSRELRRDFEQRRATRLELEGNWLEAFCVIDQLAEQLELPELVADSSLRESSNAQLVGTSSETERTTPADETLEGTQNVEWTLARRSLEEYQLYLRRQVLFWQTGGGKQSIDETSQVFPSILFLAQQRPDHLATQLLCADYAMFIGQGLFRLGYPNESRPYFERTSNLVDNLLSNPELPAADTLACCRLLVLLSNPARNDGDFDLARRRLEKASQLVARLATLGIDCRKQIIKVRVAFSKLHCDCKDYAKARTEIEGSFRLANECRLQNKNVQGAEEYFSIWLDEIRIKELSLGKVGKDEVDALRRELERSSARYATSSKLHVLGAVLALESFSLNDPNSDLSDSQIARWISNIQEHCSADLVIESQTVLAGRLSALGRLYIERNEHAKARLFFTEVVRILESLRSANSCPKTELRELFVAHLAVANINYFENKLNQSAKGHRAVIELFHLLSRTEELGPVTLNECGACVVSSVFLTRCDSKDLDRGDRFSLIENTIQSVLQARRFTSDELRALANAIKFARNEALTLAIETRNSDAGFEQLRELVLLGDSLDSHSSSIEDLQHISLCNALANVGQSLLDLCAEWRQLSTERSSLKAVLQRKNIRLGGQPTSPIRLQNSFFK